MLESRPEDHGRIDPVAATLQGHAAWLTDLQAGLQSVNAALGVLGSIETSLKGHTDWIGAVEKGLGDLRTAHDGQLDDLRRWMSSATQRISDISTLPVTPSAALQALGPAAARVTPADHLARMLQVWTVSRWVAQAPVESDLAISVIIPTRNRRPFLERAVATVLGQRHTHWQLIIVDDGSTDDTAAFLATLSDPRITLRRTDGVGASAARNAGLEAVTGAIVTHLDDDNLMDPDWLRAVAWAFTRWPDTQLLYGARIVEDAAAQDGTPSGMMPRLEFPEFDRARLEQTNTIDMNVLAHRAGLPDARFDPALRSSIEWDMLLRLTAHHTPLELPVIACLYRSHAPGRLSHRTTYLAENQIVRSRVHTTRPLRVLSYNALFPLMSETYIEEEMLALEAQGADIAFASWERSASPYAVRQPVYASLDEGVAAHNPDVIVVNWASHAAGTLDALARTGRPFALRVHSFDFDPDLLRRIQAHPSCVGIWAFPHQAAQVPGLHTLCPIFTTHTALPDPVERRVIASVSAGLPKKNWPLLMAALDQLPEHERVVVLARSNGLEHVPEEVEARAAALQHPPTVRVNMPRAEVFALLAHTSVLLYTVVPEARLGMPMSVIEGLRAGAIIIGPDRPEMHDLCGPHLRTYTTAEDIVRHVRAIAAAGPALEPERQANRALALARFCDPALGARYHAELSAAVTAWREARQHA